MNDAKPVAWNLVRWFRFFRCFLVDAFLTDFTRHLVLVGLLAIIAAILSGALASEYGAPLLFWHEKYLLQLLAGFGVGLLLAKIFFVGFLLNLERPRRWLQSFRDNGLGEASDPFDEARHYLMASAGVIILIAVVVGIVRSIYCEPSAPGHPPGPFSDWSWYRFLPLPVGAALASSVTWLAMWGLAKWSKGHIPKASDWRKKLLWLPPASEEGKHARLHTVAAVLFFLLLALFFLVPRFCPGYATPVTALCALFGLLVSAYGFIRFRVPNASLALFIICILVGIGGIDRYKVRVPIFEKNHLYEHRVSLNPSTTQSIGLVRIEDTPWVLGKRAPMVIVCTSGGGIRAMVWTGAILGQIEQQIEDFPYRIKLVSGASGGMVGAAYYVQTLQAPTSPQIEINFHHSIDKGLYANALDAMVWNLAQDGLSELIKQGVFCDVPATLWPTAISDRLDRGRALEITWGRHLGSGFVDSTLGSLAEGERQGWRPSLVFSPMIVEDGRRLLISNLDLGFMTFSRGPLLGSIGPDVNSTVAVTQPTGGFAGRTDEIYSRSAYELSRLFPEETWKSFPLSTAARLSASFPYFSPAVELPTNPRRRVVDAGYYDNYGLSVAIAWLDHLLSTDAGRQWLREHVSGIVLIQLRDGVSNLAGANTLNTDTSGKVGRGLEWLTTPPSGLLAARDSVSLFRNDAQLQRLIARCQTMERELRPRKADGKLPDTDPQYFTTVVFENPGDESLSWYLTTSETTHLISAAKSHPNLSYLLEWWRHHSTRLPSEVRK